MAGNKNNKKGEGIYFSVFFVRSTNRWKLNWKYKALATIGADYGKKKKPKKPWTPIYGPNQMDVVRKGEEIIRESLKLPAKARELSAEKRERILVKAAELLAENIDPIEAMHEGGKWIGQKTDAHKRKLADYWEGFKDSRTKDRRWSPRVLQQWELFFKQNWNHFLQKTLVDFTSRKEVAKLISEEVERWMNVPKTRRKAKNTLNKYLSKLSSFLGYIAHQNEHPIFTPHLVKDLFSEQGRLSVLELPSGLEEEQQNKKLTPEQAKHLILSLIQNYPDATIFYIMRMFAGQRTLNLMEYDWRFIDWKDRKISIPKPYTKNKKDDVEFGFDEIPNFENWILFAWNLAGKPRRGKMATNSQPTMTGRCAKIMNDHPEIYNFTNGITINGSKHTRNILRNTFISYSIENNGMGVTSRIVEDKDNLNSYISTTQAGAGNNAREYFDISPDSLDLWQTFNIPPF